MTKTFGNYIKQIRESEKQMSLRDVEKITGISNSYLSQLENKPNKLPTLFVLKRLADAYDRPLSEMADFAESNKFFQVKFSHPKKASKVNKEKLTPDVKYIVRQYLKLSDEGKNHMKDYIDFFLKKEKKEVNNDRR